MSYSGATTGRWTATAPIGSAVITLPVGVEIAERPNGEEAESKEEKSQFQTYRTEMNGQPCTITVHMGHGQVVSIDMNSNEAWG